MRLANAVLVALVVAGGLTGCSTAEGQGQPGTPAVRAPQESAQHRYRAGDRREYVAMGDSYTSAPLIGDTDSGCYRGSGNYPSLVAARLDLDLTDVSCAGAPTDAVWRPYQPIGDEPRQIPQIAALSRSTDLVTVSFGGNDFGLFSHFVQDCVAAGTELAGAPCARADALAGGLVADQTRRIADRLTGALRRIAAAAPHARVLVVSYPRITPRQPCEEFPLARGDVAFGQRVNALMVRAQRRAADRAGVGFVDVYAATRGHDACSADPYVAGASPTAPAAPYHPYAAEQQVVADLVADRFSRS